jgi:altronate hydrolase
VVLAETPEVCGAEHLLLRRAVSRDVGERLLEKIRWWEWYTGLWGATINNNPAPGNKDGGITTIFEKSLGAVAKGGTTPLREVYGYAERVTERGLVFMDTPGCDPPSVTGLVAGGCNLVAFTTGRGSCYGCVPSPSLKIASNTPLYERMPHDMDIDAGVILTGTPMERVADRIFRVLLCVASGEKTKSELQGVGEEEFAPWVLGPVL